MSNEEQIEYWNGEAGRRWAEQDAMMSRLLQPVCEALLDHAGVAGSRSALDIGCGGGSQSLMLAQRLGAGARVLGVDISAPMLAIAEEKAALTGENAATLQFLQADAANHTFEPGSFDLLFSRFGVMFFDDPTAAFSNLRGAVQDDGRLVFACWQSLAENDWTRIPIMAALQHLPKPEAPDPDLPLAAIEGALELEDAAEAARLLFELPEEQLELPTVLELRIRLAELNGDHEAAALLRGKLPPSG